VTTLEVAPRPASLAPVRAAIPESCYQRSTAKGLLYVARDLLFYAAILAALVFAPWWLALPLIGVAGLIVGSLFIVGHDAAHGALFDSDRLNGFIGRLCMLPSLHVYESWVFGHNRVHHGHTARRGLDFVWHPLTAEEYRAQSRYGRLRYRLERSWAGSGAYYVRDVWWNKMVTFRPPEKLAKRIHRDWALVATWVVLASGGAAALGYARSGTALAAAWMVVKLVIGPFLVFSQVIGWTVYVHHVGPDIRWWDRNDWTRFHAQMESTTVLRMPAVLNVFFHDIFVHVPHHVDMRIPFYHLREAAAAIEAAFPDVVADDPFRPGTYFRAVHQCKLYDFDHGCWLTFAQGALAA